MSYFTSMVTLRQSERITASFAVFLAAVVFFVWSGGPFGLSKDGQWQYYTPDAYVTVEDGVDVSGVPIMSRWSGDRWQYRKMTKDEADHLKNLVGAP
ncbi:hypothetical protein [Mesorhizobium sp. WSM3626]|uniref:hypothetical protein n=1 Tax=Mesorhizobium sp. WSM3626 TaxID=1040987 RepID=UPI0012EB4CA4|nr:hypothetical protein [Mesorhizobium sp. WSM3626]